MNRVKNSPTSAKPIHYPCTTNRRATNVVLCKDISAARVLELIEYDPIIPNIILDSVVLQTRTLPVPEIQIWFLIANSVIRDRGGSFPED